MRSGRAARGSGRRCAPDPDHPDRLDAAAFDRLARQRVAELSEDTDLDAMAVVFSLLRLANRLVQDLESEVHRPAGFSWAGFRVMFSIWVAGPLSPHAIAHLSGVSRGTTSSVLNTLERDGLVERRRDSADGRVVTVGLARKGRERLRRAYPRHNRRESEWVSTLTRPEQRTLAALLGRLLAEHPEHRSAIGAKTRG